MLRYDPKDTIGLGEYLRDFARVLRLSIGLPEV
jgi:hypothetical protein